MPAATFCQALLNINPCLILRSINSTACGYVGRDFNARSRTVFTSQGKHKQAATAVVAAKLFFRTNFDLHPCFGGQNTRI